jgi:amino acid transporter
METERRFDHLQEHSIGFAQVLFQSITHMAPAAAVAFSLLVGFSFAGPVLPLSVIFALVVALLIANSVGQLAKQMPSAGGLYTYTSRALGPKVGFLVGWAFILAEPLVAPLLYLVFAATAADVFQNRLGINIPWWVWVIVAALLVFYLTYWGIRLSTNAGIVLGIFEIAAFLALGLYMIFAAGGENTLQVFNPANSLEGTWSGVFKGMVFSILAFIGFEAAAPLGEEARNPRRTIPRVVLSSALVIGLFYLVCAYASVMGWGFGRMSSYAENPDPWTTMAENYWGVGWVIIFLAIVNSAIANANAGVNAATRVIYAMGRIDVLPSVFGRTHPEHRTPYIAIIAQSILALVVALVLGAAFEPVGGFSIIATAVTIVVILVYMMVSLACMVFYLRERRDQFNVLLHGVFPVLAILILLAPLYYQFAPLPDYPVRLGNYFAIAWILLGFLALGLAASQRPQAIAQAEEVFVEDETVAPEAGSSTRST